jgi:hypothetical protein
MSKTKTLVLAVSVLTSLAATGLSAGTAQAQTGRDRPSIAVSELSSALDRAEYTGFRGGWGHRGGGWGHRHGWGYGFGYGGYTPAYYYGGCYLKRFVTYYGDVVFKKLCY